MRTLAMSHIRENSISTRTSKPTPCTGNGKNMWFAADAFHFVWRATAGGCAAGRPMSPSSAKGNIPHRKACLLDSPEY